MPLETGFVAFCACWGRHFSHKGNSQGERVKALKRTGNPWTVGEGSRGAALALDFQAHMYIIPHAVAGKAIAYVATLCGLNFPAGVYSPLG